MVLDTQSLVFDKCNRTWEKTYYCQPHDDVIKWKHFPRNWPLCAGNSPVPVNSAHKGQWRGALMFSLICVWINGLVNNREAGDLRRHRGHFDVNVMLSFYPCIHNSSFYESVHVRSSGIETRLYMFLYIVGFSCKNGKTYYTDLLRILRICSYVYA